MIQGTTPIHKFTLQVDTSELAEVRVVYGFNGSARFIKETSDCFLEGNTITVPLTQAETYKFRTDVPGQVQLRAMTTDGRAMSTRIMTFTVEPSLDRGVIL